MSALAVNPLHLDDTGTVCLVLRARYFGIPANVTQLKPRFDEAAKAFDCAKLLLAAARRFCYRIPRERRPQLLSRITFEGQWSGELMFSTKRNDLCPEDDTSWAGDVAGLVLMQVDAVNVKEDELAIAIKGLTDTAKQLVRVYSDHAQTIVRLKQRLRDLEGKQRMEWAVADRNYIAAARRSTAMRAKFLNPTWYPKWTS